MPRNLGFPDDDPLWFYAPVRPAPPVGGVGAIPSRMFAPLGHYDDNAWGIPPWP